VCTVASSMPSARHAAIGALAKASSISDLLDV
jgi:hypothetical protein